MKSRHFRIVPVTMYDVVRVDTVDGEERLTFVARAPVIQKARAIALMCTHWINDNPEDADIIKDFEDVEIH